VRSVDKVAMTKGFLRTSRFSLADHHFTLALYSSIDRLKLKLSMLNFPFTVAELSGA
jgi:hypothetical protein